MCEAEVGYILHAGQKEDATDSVQPNQIAHYSLMKPFNVGCQIE